MRSRGLLSLSVVLLWGAVASCSPSNPSTPGGADGGRADGAGPDSADGIVPDAATTDGSVPDAGGHGVDAATCQADLQHDPLNCGRCGRSCGGGACLQGVCAPVLVLDAQEQPYGPTLNELATFVDQGSVYEWEYTTTSAIHYLVQRAASTPTDPVSKGDSVQDVPSDPSIDAVAFDSTYIYEAVEGAAAGAQGQVARKRLDRSEGKGAATKMFSLPPDLRWKNIAVTADAIYLTGTTRLNGPGHPDPDTTAFYRIDRAAITPDGLSLPTVIDSLGARNELVTDLTVVGAHLFWLEYDLATSDYLVFTAPVSGGTPVQLDDANTTESSFASDATYVYWAQINDNGNLMRCPLASLDAAHVTAVAPIASAREGIVSQGQYVYVMELPDPRPLYRVNVATGAKEFLGDMELPPSEKGTRVIGADADFVYMTTIDAKVWRLPSAP